MAELGQLLDEAKATITGGRQDSYGSPEDSFAKIAAYWSIYLKRRVEPREVAEMMTLFKIARMQGQKPHRDNYLDACGYLSIAADRMLAPPVYTQLGLDAIATKFADNNAEVEADMRHGERRA